jgi:hypothetical protein
MDILGRWAAIKLVVSTGAVLIIGLVAGIGLV